MMSGNLFFARHIRAWLLCLFLAIGSNPGVALAKAKVPADICATQSGDAARPKMISADGSIIVYNFLDVRSAQYTPKVMDRIEAKLLSCLTQYRQAAAIVRSQNMPFVKQNPEWQAIYSGRIQTLTVPVEDFIASNAEEEKAKSARYRLTIQPTEFTITGAWRTYKILWELVDVKTNEAVWSYEYVGRHMAMWSDSENADSRSNKIILAAFLEMRGKNVL
jgi:hypothetical protein